MRRNRIRNEAPSKQKERHIVTWTPEEDDILREQINIHGTENWVIIASKFNDKTTRQCRRRWYTYLNSDFKKGGWSPEEDMLLCEAQKAFGNRWTEIAKVVSGRTDNAVKNRFTTLCKKRAKCEALAKENNISLINPSNKGILFQDRFDTDGASVTTPPLKKMRRTHISYIADNYNHDERVLSQCRTTNQQLRPPFAVLVQNFDNVGNSQVECHNTTKESRNDVVGDNKIQATFLKKDDPKINALMQQAELLSSLALKVNIENTDQSLESAWKVLQDFLSQNKEGDMYNIADDFQLEDFKDLLEDLRSTNKATQSSWRQPELYESPGSSQYSTGSNIRSLRDIKEAKQDEICAPNQDTRLEAQLLQTGDQNGLAVSEDGVLSGNILMACGESENNGGAVSPLLGTDFSSPLQVTPIFRSLAAAIPSPKFSESERNFLMKTLGMESPCPNPETNPSQLPQCRRALLHSL